MTPERMAEVRVWRDAQLVRWYGDEAAASRLREGGSVRGSLALAFSMVQPTLEELEWCDVSGEPLDPSHPWWGYQGPSAIELRARREGLPWPPDDDPNPYGGA